MLAGKAPSELSKLRFPLLASRKLDGVRCLIIDGVAYSRNMKPIPSKQVQTLFGRKELNGLDGELLVGSPCAPDAYRRTVSSVMSANNPDMVRFHAFDCWDMPGKNFEERSRALFQKTEKAQSVLMVEQRIIYNLAVLEQFENAALAEGYEGLMIRYLEHAYKYGRSTSKEAILLKLKRFSDSEATVLSVAELQHNGNAATLDELGRSRRAAHKAGKLAGGTLGALRVRDLRSGVEFDVGTGFDAAERADLWARQDSIIGSVIKYRFFPGGVKDKPRFPVFCGFRHSIDL